jgi:hypothetical protein
VGGALGVGVAGELDAGRLELAAQAGEILDDAVVDDGDPAVGGEVRVGVAVGRAAVRGPPGRSASAFSRLASLPAFFSVRRVPSTTTATPAESYPRYSSRRRPSRTMLSAGRLPT